MESFFLFFFQKEHELCWVGKCNINQYHTKGINAFFTIYLFMLKV